MILFIVSKSYVPCLILQTDPNSQPVLQMIESSAHGDEYDGVIFSQLVSLEFFITFICEIYYFSCLVS